jgi:Fe-Mn family superoxide dismutase
MIEKVNIDYRAGLPGFMSSETIDYHYGKHYQGYLDKVNKYYEEHSNNLLNIINPDKDIDKEAKFNACQAYNHQLFFEQLTYIENQPCEELMDWFVKEFGSFEEFKTRFEKESNEFKGSGYVTLSICKTCIGEHASISSFKNETNSYISYMPNYGLERLLLTLDLWEHAYYIDFRNNRSEYIKNFWQYVNWDVVYKRLKSNI